MLKKLTEYTAQEWEDLCDGCGLCCLEKFQDGEDGEVVISNIACNYLNLETCKCSDYENRHKNMPNCEAITPENVNELYWLPHTCAYKIVAHGEELPEWHHLICGDKNRVHTEGPSMLGELISQDDARNANQ